MNELTIYNYKTISANALDDFVTITGVQLEDILNEYSVEDIVEALIATDKHADVIDEIIKRNREE